VIEVAQGLALAVAVVNLAAGLTSAFLWWRVDPRPWAWWLIRAGQAAGAALAAGAGVLVLTGFEPADGLFWLYALLPVAVSFVAEQLRLASAQTILDARGLADAQAVGGLEPVDQRSVVLAIMRREIGVMAVAAMVIAFLALRALGEAS
jgi:hypothetical protein